MSVCLGVCSWSLRPQSPRELVRSVRACGLSAVQLALDPIREGRWNIRDALRELTVAGISIRSGNMGMKGEDYSTLDSIRATGGVRPDEHWSENLAAARSNADLARQFGLDLVTFHAGFLPHTRGDALRGRMIERLRVLCDVFAAAGVRLAFETGQETADTLLDVLEELGRPAAGVNFDPANMILYDMGDPVAALRRLATNVRQIHVKDARHTRTPGTWGEEVRVGDGDVDWPAFFRAYRESGLTCDLMIEREAGDGRIADVRHAAEFVRRQLDAGAESGAA
ncbi:MAG: sugar phosphate isomerase/epimerase [Phycisphaerae bacterium]|jgi:sugar phosphate isomerase/epimerase